MSKYVFATLPVGAASMSRGRGASLLRGVALALLGSLAVALAAHVAIPLPFTPVPLTLQPMAVLLIGLLFAPSLSFATMLLYLAEGAMGLPVFQPHGAGGLLQLAGPTGGFLWSYPLVAMLAGTIYGAVTRHTKFMAGLLACTVAVVVLFAAGASQLAIWTHASFSTVLTAAVLPFLPGEIIKVVAASGIAAAWSSRCGQ